MDGKRIWPSRPDVQLREGFRGLQQQQQQIHGGVLRTAESKKKERTDLESGSWGWTDGDGIAHTYDYDEEQSGHGLQNSVTASWLNSVENAHVFQVEAGPSFDRTITESDKSVRYGLGDVEQNRTGSYYDKVRYVSPTLDLYWEKALSETSSIALNLTGTLYATNQDTRSTETAVTGKVASRACQILTRTNAA